MTTRDTSLDFDDCIGKVDEETKPITLFEVENDDPTLDELFIPENEQEAARRLWVGMPAYKSDKQKAFKSLIVNFSTEEDYNLFNEKLDLVPTKAKSIFYPETSRDNLIELGWVDATNV